MWQSLLHLWASPPANVKLTCPLPAPGDPPDLNGFFDPAPVNAAYGWTALATGLLVLLAVLACYLLDRRSLSRAFVLRWWLVLAIASVVGALVPLVMLYVVVPQHALVRTCDTFPLAFSETYPVGLALSRALAGLVWSALAFGVFSFVLTRATGWHPASGGFFHNRGCPWPRINPFGA
ncbi:hypothetical protein [Longimicrobium sp.]|uniref:hypothetical protein n=1 Tax=Longimicrobium sp. TaxID=2029185 RepID=UPI003B3B7F9C